MNSKFIVYVLIVQIFQYTRVETKTNIYLSYHYETKNEVTQPVCMNKDEYAVPKEDEVVIYVQNVERIVSAYSRCTLQKHMDIVASDRFLKIPDSDIYIGQLNDVRSELYNCSFYVLKKERKRFEPTAVFNNVTYVRISCLFKLQVYPKKPILITADVDGKILKPSKKSIDNVINFEYKYSKKQELMVTCTKKTTKGIVELIIPESYRQSVYSKASTSRVKYKVNNPWVVEPYFTIKCILHDFRTTLEVYNIHFTPKRTPDGIDVEGLTTSNIVEDKDDKRLLYYKYTDIEEINLICSMFCHGEVCRMEMRYKGKRMHITVCSGGQEIKLSHLLLLTPADNSSIIECGDYHNLGSVNQSQLQFIHITLHYVDEEIQRCTTTLQPNGCSDAENTAGTNINYTSDWPHMLQATSPTILPTNSSQSSTASDFPKSFLWIIVSVIIIVLAGIVLIVYRTCKHRRRSKHIAQRPQLPLPESVHLDTFPSASQNIEEHEYEEIPERITRPIVPNVRQLRRIPDMRLDRQNGRLIVKGKAINLQKLLQEAEYVETK